jgi:hypothetical protein
MFMASILVLLLLLVLWFSYAIVVLPNYFDGHIGTVKEVTLISVVITIILDVVSVVVVLLFKTLLALLMFCIR